MKMLIKGLILCGGVLFTTQAFALSQPCRQAASLGGPCGCVASEIIFGHSDRNLWAVSQWLARFPRTSAAPGTAAVWPGRHVEAVVAVNGDGTVTTNGPYGTRRVRTGGLVFVDPKGSGGTTQVASGTVGRTHVAYRARSNVHVAVRSHTRHYASRHYAKYAENSYTQVYRGRDHYAQSYKRNERYAEVAVPGYGH